jgi:integrase
MAPRIKEPHAIDPRKLPSGRWKGRVQYWDPDTEQRKETTQTFATEREAKKWSREEEARLRQDPNRQPPSEVLFGEFYARWLTEVAQGRVRDTTAVAYRRYGKPLLADIGNKPLRALVPADFQRIYARMRDEGKATSTVYHTHVVAHSALDAAVLWGILPSNPVDRVKAPRVVSPEIVPPTPEQSHQLLEAVEQDRLKALWWFITLVGCRKGEALGLKWDDIDWTQQTAMIRRTVAADGGLLTIHDPKPGTKGRRAVALSKHLISVLREHEQRQTLERQAEGSGWNPQNWVFPSERGTLCWPSNVNRRFRRLRAQAGLPKTLRPHDLRHAMASAWLNAGVPIKVVSERLGHASISITLQIYGHLLPHMQAVAADEMESAFLDQRAAFGPHEDSKKAVSGNTVQDDGPE